MPPSNEYYLRNGMGARIVYDDLSKRADDDRRPKKPLPATNILTVASAPHRQPERVPRKPLAATKRRHPPMEGGVRNGFK